MINNVDGMLFQANEKNSQKKFEILFEEMTEALFLHDFNGNIKRVNKKACEYLKLEKEVLEVMNIKDFVADDVINSFQEGFKKQFRERQYRYEANYINKNNTEIPIEITSRPLKLGKSRMILTGFRDISLQKHYENLLIQSKKETESNENELKLIFDNSPSCILLFDEEMKILRVNKKTFLKFYIDKSIVGKKISELVVCNETECFHFENENINNCKFLNIFNQTIKGKNFLKEEVQISIKNQDTIEKKTVLISTSLLKRNGQSLYLANIDDITNRKKMELELLDAKEKAEESDKLKTAFIENLHHDIRTPLNGILGFIDFFADDSYNFSMNEKKELIEVMHKSGDRLIKTINDLLEISKLDIGILKVNKKSFELKIYLDNFIKEQQSKFKNTDIKFLFEIDTALENKTIHTDKAKLFQVLQNLLDNAYKFTTKGFVKLSVVKEIENLKILIEDSGIGIAPEFHDFIFKPFWQVNKDPDRYYEGNGLGLAVSKKIINSIGGTLHVKSDLGKGSTFVINLPKLLVSVNSPKNNVEIQTNTHKSLEGKTILICEDEMSHYIYLKTALLNEKCRLIHASSGIEALEIFKENTSIDLVLMDLKMPDMNGLEAAAKIKQIRKNIPIIAQSAQVIDSEMQKATKAGFVDFLIKPINKDILISTILKHLK